MSAKSVFFYTDRAPLYFIDKIQQNAPVNRITVQARFDCLPEHVEYHQFFVMETAISFDHAGVVILAVPSVTDMVDVEITLPVHVSNHSTL